MKTVFSGPTVEYKITNFTKPYLLQGLESPRPDTDGRTRVLERMAFGAGGHGLTEDAEKLVMSIWSWQYMGAGEYERGGMQTALKLMADYHTLEKLVAAPMEVSGWEPSANRDFSWYSRGKAKIQTTVFVIGCSRHMDQIKETLNELLGGTLSLKRGISAWDRLFSPASFHNDKDCRFRGALDIENGWLFFTDEAMFRQTCNLFELPIPGDAIKAAKFYIPPKMLFHTTKVENLVAEFLHKNYTKDGFLDFLPIAQAVYPELTAEFKSVPDQFHWATQVEKALAYLTRKGRAIKVKGKRQWKEAVNL